MEHESTWFPNSPKHSYYLIGLNEPGVEFFFQGSICLHKWTEILKSIAIFDDLSIQVQIFCTCFPCSHDFCLLHIDFQSDLFPYRRLLTCPSFFTFLLSSGSKVQCRQRTPSQLNASLRSIGARSNVCQMFSSSKSQPQSWITWGILHCLASLLSVLGTLRRGLHQCWLYRQYTFMQHLNYSYIFVRYSIWSHDTP